MTEQGSALLDLPVSVTAVVFVIAWQTQQGVSGMEMQDAKESTLLCMT